LGMLFCKVYPVENKRQPMCSMQPALLRAAR
jgi:hypothetical protein